MKQEFTISTIHRVIAHRIVKKADGVPCYADTHDSLFTLNSDDKDVLIQRIEKAVNNRKKCFELSFRDRGRNSMFEMLRGLGYVSGEQEYIDFSKETAGKLSESQDNISIPGGYCLVVDGKLKSGKYFICIIKADYQEVFNVHENLMKVLNDVFLSPVKDFYKVGFFVQDKNNGYVPYMYDDQFSIYKEDLTLYFYDRFLGLSTDENNRIKTKNMFLDIKDFIENNVDNLADMNGLKAAMRSYFRDNTEGHVSVAEFSDRYLRNTTLEDDFKKQYGDKYPRAIVLDTTLLSPMQLQTQRTILSDKITILTKEGVTMKELDQETIKKINPSVNSGTAVRAILFETAEEA